MKTIHKFHFDILSETQVVMPFGAEVVTVQMQKGCPCLWAIVETENHDEGRTFCIRGTGHPFTGNEGKYIGTVQAMNGDLVLHVFEKVSGI